MDTKSQPSPLLPTPFFSRPHGAHALLGEGPTPGAHAHEGVFPLEPFYACVRRRTFLDSSKLLELLEELSPWGEAAAASAHLGKFSYRFQAQMVLAQCL